jgi:hypothetical protein
MSRKNHIHLADAFIYGYSNFTFTEPTTTSRVGASSTPMAFDETDNRFSQTPTPVLITPTLETVKPTYVRPEVTPTFIPSFEDEKPVAPIIDIINPSPVYVRPESTPSPYIVLEDDVRPPAPTPFVPIIDIINPTPVYVKPDAIPTVTPSYEDDIKAPRPPAPTPFVPIIDIINPSPVYVRPESTPTFMPTSEDNVNRTILDSKPYHKPTESSISPTFIAEDDGRKPITPSPIVNIINPSPYVAPPLIVGGGAGGAGGSGGGAMGGGKPLSGSATTKPSFLKKNFIPLLLIASAIYVFIKKPIK